MPVGEILQIFNWWIIFAVLGIAGLPLMFKVFKGFFDLGYGLSKTFSLLILSYTVFLFSTLRILPFTRITIFTIFVIYLILNIFLYIKNKKEIDATLLKNFPVIILEELLFASGLLLWAFVRGHQPDINGLEKFMDFGFVNSILRSEYLPPADMWFAGKTINYYWFGHYIAAFATKISGIPSTITYNLMLGTILGLALSGSFSLVSNLINAVLKAKRLAVIGGLISALLLNFAGNFHTPYYVLKNGKEAYWYPDATRFIGYNPDSNDKTIHEFPIYSYVVADLHAHLLNFPFVILFLSLLYVAIQKNKHLNKISVPVLGFVLGSMFMANAWDFANYLLVSGVVILTSRLKKFGLKLDSFYKTAIPLIGIILSAIIITLPFTVHFESIAEGASLTHTKTPLWQLAILWGFPAVLTLIFSIRSLLKKAIVENEDLFVISLLIASWTLIILPEFVYVKDIYIASHYRANTMFKLTYQAYVMFYTVSGFIAVRIIRDFAKIYQKILAIFFFTALFGSLLYYPKIAVNSYYGELKNYKGLSGDTWLKEKSPDTFDAIDWLIKNTEGQPVILEAPGDSYTEYDSISSYTGLPTVSGWFVHEWLWRGSPEFPQERVNDIVNIYTAEEINLTKSLLQKYKVKYVIVGNFEREKYSNLVEDKFNTLGKPVFTSPTTKIYQMN